jgi:hypothetical protein
MSTDFARLTDLFQEGTVLELSKGEQTITVWINKLSPFEMEEARQDGRVARARLVLALKEIGSPEYVLFRSSMDDISDEALIHTLLEARSNEWVAQAVRDIRSDKDWTERVEVIEQSSELVGRPADDPEVKLMSKLAVEYTEHVQQMAADSREEERAVLLGASRAQLEAKYEESYLEQRGLTAFTVEYQRTEVFHAVRECKATRRDDTWDHDLCNHNQRVCANREAVAQLPERVWQLIRQAIVELNMPVDVARFMAAPASSSASLEQPSEAVEESTASIPEETPVEPAGIS